jgi:hypothetical protein
MPERLKTARPGTQDRISPRANSGIRVASASHPAEAPSTRPAPMCTAYEIAPFLAGEMSRFAPLPASLQVADAVNPLKKPRPPSPQGELF